MKFSLVVALSVVILASYAAAQQEYKCGKLRAAGLKLTRTTNAL